LLVFVRNYRLPGLALADLVSPSVMLGLAFGRVGCFLNGCCFGGVCDEPWAVRFPSASPPHMAQAKAGKLTIFGLVLAADDSGRPIVKSVEPGSQAADAGLVPGQRLTRIRVNELEYPIATVDEALFALEMAQHLGDQVLVYADGSLPASWTVAAPPSRTRPVHPAQLYAAIDALLLCLLLLAYYPYRRRDGEVFALMITIHPVSRFLQEIIRVDESSVFGTSLSISQNVSILMFVGALGLWFYLSRQSKGSVWPLRMAAGM
jgi:phosphatidylglycerol:prolipoprotein diacylglycerol transferase